MLMDAVQPLARGLALLAPVALAACADDGQPKGTGVVMLVIVGPVVALAVALVVVIIRGIVVGWTRNRRWLETASVGSADLAGGELVWMTFQPRPGTSYVIWLNLDVQGPTHSFELAITVRADGGTPFDQVWRAWIDDDEDDHGLRGTPLVGTVPLTGEVSSMLNMMNAGWRWRAIHRVLPFVFATTEPASIGVRLRPTEQTEVRGARAHVTAGEAP